MERFTIYTLNKGKVRTINAPAMGRVCQDKIEFVGTTADLVAKVAELEAEKILVCEIRNEKFKKCFVINGKFYK